MCQYIWKGVVVMKTVTDIKASVCKAALSAVSVCTRAMLLTSANSVASPVNGQAEPPKSLKKYRKF